MEIGWPAIPRRCGRQLATLPGGWIECKALSHDDFTRPNRRDGPDPASRTGDSLPTIRRRVIGNAILEGAQDDKPISRQDGIQALVRRRQRRGGAPSTATSPPSPSSTVSPAPTPVRPSIVSDGDAVVAYGNLFETGIASETLLCPAVGSPPDSTGCHGTVVVTVRGVDARELPGLETDPNVPDLPGGAWVTQWVRIDGVWADGAFQATRVELAERPLFLELIQTPDVPCDPATSGLPGGSPDDIERAWEVLEAEISRDPDTYSGISSAVIRGPDGGGFRPAIVVGTVLEVESVAQRLHAIYPYKPCILRVDHSAHELQQAAEAVRALKQPWDVLDSEYGFGHVIVRVPVLDERTAAMLEPFGTIVSIRPIVLVHED